MTAMLNDENARHHENTNENGSTECYSTPDILSYLAVISRGMPFLTTSHRRNLRPVEVAMRLLWDVAILHGYNDTNSEDKEEEEDDDNGVYDEAHDHDIDIDIDHADHLVHRIRTNDPTLTTLALRYVRVLNRGQPVSSFREFTQSSIQQATEALHANHTIRSVSCSYDWRYPKRILDLLRNSHDGDQQTDGTAGRDDDHHHHHHQQQQHRHYYSNQCNQRAATASCHQVTKLQERRFFEACVCLPHLESISLTGGNRWRISHLITILDTAKGLKKLVVRDVLIKSSSELNGLKRLLLPGKKRRSSSSSSNNNCNNYSTSTPILLEAIELTIEDKTDRNDKYWTTATASSTMNNDESPFDGLLESLISSPNIHEIKLSKSILSRFHARPVHDVSKKTLLKLARCQSLSKLVLSGTSIEKGGIEAMCESLMQTNCHLTHLEFSGCAFNHSVGQSGWNALFRLIDHDPTIQIKASSLVYRRHRRRRRPESDGDDNTIDTDTVNTNANTNTEQQTTHETASKKGEQQQQQLLLGLSSFVRFPREDFSFSLRDKDGSQKHFRNRGLDVQYVLQEAGFFQLLRSSSESNNYNEEEEPPNRYSSDRDSDWIRVMIKVRDNSIALFCILRENPVLCDRMASWKAKDDPNHNHNTREGNNKAGRETKKRRTPSPLVVLSKQQQRTTSWQTMTRTGLDRSNFSASPRQCLCSATN